MRGVRDVRSEGMISTLHVGSGHLLGIAKNGQFNGIGHTSGTPGVQAWNSQPILQSVWVVE